MKYTAACVASFAALSFSASGVPSPAFRPAPLLPPVVHLDSVFDRVLPGVFDLGAPAATAAPAGTAFITPTGQSLLEGLTRGRIFVAGQEPAFALGSTDEIVIRLDTASWLAAAPEPHQMAQAGNADANAAWPVALVALRPANGGGFGPDDRLTIPAAPSLTLTGVAVRD